MPGTANQVKPHIYLHLYPSGLKFWKVRRAFKKHSRHRPEEKANLAAAYAFVQRLNMEIDVKNNKKTWLIYINEQYVGDVWERTEEEALNAGRAIHHPPEEGGDIYPGDQPSTIRVVPLY